MFVLTFAMLIAIVLYGLLYKHSLLMVIMLVLGVYIALERYFNIKGKTSFRRKIQILTWGEKGDPTSWAKIEVDLENTEKFIADYNTAHPDNRITLTMIALKGLGHAMASAEKSWGKLSFGNFIPSDSVDITVLVNVDDENVVNTVVTNCEKASVETINAQLKSHIKQIKQKKDADLNFQLKIVNLLPTFMVKIMLTLTSFIVYELNMPFVAMKVKKNHFGNAILTNVTSFNLTDVYASHVPFTKAMLVCMLNTPELRPAAVNGEVVVKKLMNVNFLFDMRFVELKELAQLLKTVKEVFENPAMYVK